MESIGDVLKRKFGLNQRFEQTKQALLSDPLVQKVMEKFDLNNNNVDPYLTQLESVRVSHANCQQCKGLSECSNQQEGHKTIVMKHNGLPAFINKPCDYLKVDIERRRQQSLIKSYYVTDELREITFKDVQIKDEKTTRRADILEFLINYAKQVVPGQDGIGIYLYGWFGEGKTFMMWALVNYLAKRGISSVVLYVPDFVRELKNSSDDRSDSIEEKIKAVKEVPVLVLDDIGSETLTPRIRDEIIGAILQHRVNAKLPTLYTSNKSLQDLREALAYTSANGKENQKADRIMQRIEHYTHVLRSEGKNRRSEKNAHVLKRLE